MRATVINRTHLNILIETEKELYLFQSQSIIALEEPFMNQLVKNTVTFLLVSMLSTGVSFFEEQNAFAADKSPVTVEPERASSGGGSGFLNTISFGGPSVHLDLGFKTKKAPDEDEFYSAYGGFKGTLFNVGFGEHVYVSILGATVVLQRDAIFALGWSPIIIGHKFGVGLSVDFFTVSERTDRPGGKWGLTLNFDLFRLAALLKP